MPLIWYVYDLRFSQVEIFDINNIVEYLSTIYGGISLHWVEVHDNMNMENFNINKVIVKVLMVKYLTNALKRFPEHLDTTTATPAADHLLKVLDESEYQ